MAYSTEPTTPPCAGSSIRLKVRSYFADWLCGHSSSTSRPGRAKLSRWFVLPGEHHLEEGCVGRRAFWVEGFDEAFEGDVLVVVGGEGFGAYVVEEVGEGGVAVEVGAQDPGVDEEADEVGEVVVGAVGDGGADGDVVAGAEAVQEDGQGCLQDHRGGRSVGTGELADGGGQLRIEGEFQRVAAVAGLGGAGPVGGQVRGCGRSASSSRQ
nr:hypothetical protein [Streptomyces alboflavus]